MSVGVYYTHKHYINIYISPPSIVVIMQMIVQLFIPYIYIYHISQLLHRTCIYTYIYRERAGEQEREREREREVP